VCVCVCVCERERERESQCTFVRWVLVGGCVCVCVREREREPYLEKVTHKGISGHTFNKISLQKEYKKIIIIKKKE
jgi:hypothetical protein